MSGAKNGAAAPLAGLKVVALEQAVALPFATFILAELGADVIKIERPTGDVIRGWDTVVDGQSTGFVWLNAGKRDISLDLTQEDGQSVAQRIVATADVFVENFAPGVADRLGLSVDHVGSLNPEVVYCSLSGFGQTGPYRDRKAYDLIVQGESGLLLTNGTPEAPAKIGIPVTDLIGGSTAAILILAALRDQGGNAGHHLDVSMLDAVMPWLGYYPHFAWHTDEEPIRTGLRHQYTVPYGPYRASDGRYVNFAVASPEHWSLFCESVIGLPQWADDPRFASPERRTRNRSELESLVERAIATAPAELWQARFAAVGIPFGDVRTIGETLSHPQIAHRRMVVNAATPNGPVPTMRFPGSEIGKARWIPSLGQHTIEVLSECGYSPAEIDRFVANKAVVPA